MPRNQEWYLQIHSFKDFETLNYESFKKVDLINDMFNKLKIFDSSKTNNIYFSYQ